MIVVVGAGVAGVLTAWQLADRGHEVTVIEQHAGPALGCSFGNAGIVAIAHAEAWGSPAAPWAMVRALFGKDPAIRISNLHDPALWSWGLSFLRQCLPKTFQANSKQMLNLCRRSQQELQRISNAEAIPYQTTTSGTIYLFQNQKQFDHRLGALEKDPTTKGVFDSKSVDALIDMEPSLEAFRQQLVGGFHSSLDDTGHCHLFVSQLAERLHSSGRVRFLYNCKMTGFSKTGGTIESVTTDQGSIKCTGVIIATGAQTTPLLKPYGVKPQIYPVKGYHVTYDIIDDAYAPNFSMLDETELICITKLGPLLRFTGFAELAGGDLSLTEAPLAHLENYAERMFGNAIRAGTGRRWAGSRPATPSSLPYVEQAKGWTNLWLNAGHGQLGWTMSAATAAQIADLVTAH